MAFIQCTTRDQKDLTNPQTRLDDDAVYLEVYVVDEDGNETLYDGADELVLRYANVGRQWQKPRLRIHLVNNSTQTLYCGLLNLVPSYRVWAAALPGSLNTLKLNAHGDAWAASGKQISMAIPDELCRMGPPNCKIYLNRSSVPPSLTPVCWSRTGCR